MHYISTRGEAPRLGFAEVLLAGLARDGGLYLPETWPQVTPDQIAGFAGVAFADVAVRVIEPYTGGAIHKDDLARMARESYATFGHPAVTPLVQIGPDRWVLELFHGPTLAFKDVAMQLLARMMDHVLAERGTRAMIVGATSGDTGGAAIEAFRGADHVDIVILFPKDRVSDVQRRMMTTPTETNVHAVAVDGTFDDCQALVKAMFNDHAFRDRVRLSGVNSINWARIVAQVTYYFVAASALGAPGRKANFIVPTGNFGDIFAAYVAGRMGLPIGQLVIASNDNNILPRAHESGVYETREVVATRSPSMDIQISSNFERYLFEASGRDAALIRGMMAALKQSRRFELGHVHAAMTKDFLAWTAHEADVARTIQQVQRESGYLLDPHTATAAAHRLATPGPAVVLATAHPAKFPDAMEAITGRRPPLPERLAGLMRAPERFDVVANDLAKVEAYVEERSRGSGQARGRA
ncbi:MAG: threonine synthase [Hyphomicrobiaceae bacterium]|nr:threonine synthase [Hyphomicrobiaceae bacterium]